MKLAIFALGALGLFPLAGCVTGTDADPGVDATPPSTITPDFMPCPDWGCGKNSPVMGPYEFHELNTAGIKNTQGITILSFQKGNNLYQPEVTSAKLVAYPLDPTVATTLWGSALAGGWFNIQTPSGVFKLDVTAVTVEGIAYWVGAPNINETYLLQYEYPGVAKPMPLCNTPPDPIPGDAPDHKWAQPYDALLFTGDRYDAVTKTVTASSFDTTEGWFNIACAGSAIAKLHLNRHTSAGSPGPGLVTTTRAQRQAMLKMYVSDICGLGHAFTAKGVPLHWRSSFGWGNTSPLDAAHEAYWTDAGAVCLDTHRLGSLLLDEIHANCRPPPCPAQWPRGAYLTSTVPFPVP